MTKTALLRVEPDLRDDLKLLKGILHKANMTEVIRELMTRLKYNEDFFERLAQVLEDPYEKQAFDKRMPGDSLD